jgi:hypothetical protein
VFGREHVHTIVFDDLKADPASVYQDTLRFLNVGLNFAPGFKMANANLQVRNARLQRRCTAAALLAASVALCYPSGFVLESRVLS